MRSVGKFGDLLGVGLDIDKKMSIEKVERKFSDIQPSPILPFKGSHYPPQRFPLYHLDIPILHQNINIHKV